MINRETFYTSVREQFGKLNQLQVAGFNAILENVPANMLPAQLAYCLATAWHETAATMQPIEEIGKGRNRTYGHRVKLSGKPYFDTANIFYGRGFVQLTWYENYEKAGKKLSQDFIKNPAGVMELNNAVKIMFLGMQEGWFTGRKLSQYINDQLTDFVNARRIINSLDRAADIAGYAEKFLKALSL